MPSHSQRLNRWFNRFLKVYFRRNFNAVRLAADSATELSESRPLIVCTNHPSWWDPITLLLTGHFCFPNRRCFGPIDATALSQYPILGKLGLFGVDKTSKGSLKSFLTACDEILGQRDSALGLTAQGEFSDPRRRPITLEPGIGHLLRRNPDAMFSTIALEYPFWNERSPEVLIRIGPVLTANPDRGNQSPDELTRLAANMLDQNMTRLAALSETRDSRYFETLIDGRKGVGGFYDVGRRLKSWARGEAFDASHAAAGRKRVS